MTTTKMDKAAQFLDFPFLDAPHKEPEVFEERTIDSPEIENEQKFEDGEVLVTIPDELELTDEEGKEVFEPTEEVEGKKEYIFKLEPIPGAEISEDEIKEDDDEPVIVEEDKPRQPVDEWDWEGFGGTGKFLDWLQERFTNLPKHSGKDTTGVERAISYFQKLDSVISQAMRKDFKREIDAAKAEEARSEIADGMERLIARLEKLQSKKFKKTKKRANISEQFVKSAATTTTGNMIVMIPYFVSHIARACMDATISGGKDMNECLKKLAKTYNLDKREKIQVVQLLKDMGYPMFLDTMNPFDDAKPSDESKEQDYINQYYA